jgi:hypothetical protein
MRSTENEFHRVKQFVATGLSDYKIAALTGISRSTVLRWRRRDQPPQTGSARALAAQWSVPEPATYCYPLGCYLGDGHITHRPPNGWSLHVACDRQYGAIIDEIATAMCITFPGRKATRHPKSTGASDVVAISHPAIGLAFPQHGAGRKHLRLIELADWQLAVTRSDPGALIRGLIHSDGCRAMNRFRIKLPSGRMAEYSYVRYFFSNLSADIRQIFIDHCELPGVRVTQPNHRNLSVSHRDSIAILEALVGPKR